jgi:two-component SAPR family response regulator
MRSKSKPSLSHLSAVVSSNDDEFSMICVEYLDMVGIKTAATTSINEVCETCCKFPTNLVLIDIEFPQYGGIYIAKYLRLLLPQLKIILLVPQDEIGVFSVGDQHIQVLAKPVDVYHLYDLIKKLDDIDDKV